MKIEPGSWLVVTGGSSGLGAATVRALVAKGAKVLLMDLKENHDLVKELGEDKAFSAGPVDVANEGQVAASLAQGVQKFGTQLIGAINCAGIGSAQKLVDREGKPASLSYFEFVVRVNLTGSFNVDRLVAAQMVKGTKPNADGERGVLVHTASGAAFEGQAGQSAYSAAKSGLVGMMIPLARDLAPVGIRVVTIAPGLFETPLMSGAPDKLKDSLLRTTEFPKRMGVPDEFAHMAVACVENAMLNGTTIRLDGALRLGKI
ncbi:3-hydroxyacyl-CoA dehydrogenase [Hyaloraphidium curvatum]|nr:3-hydroxyacyl-CoA dehydrogenase [Hyaloraphidium curvatum]